MLKNFKHKIQNNTYLNSVFFNTGWLLFDRLYRMGLGLLVGVFVARYLGPELFGEINFALAFVTIAAALTTLGLDSIAIRELINGKPKNEVLGTTFYARLTLSIITAIGIITYVLLTNNAETASRSSLILVLSFLSIFQSFDTIDMYFQSIARSKYAVYARNISFSLMAAYRIVLVLCEASVFFFCFAMLLEVVITSAFLLFYFQRKTDLSIKDWKFNAGLFKSMLADSWPLILASLSVILYMRLDQVMLGEMASVKEVGDYSAACRLVEVWYFIPTAITSSLYPFILKAKADSNELYRKRMLSLYSLLMWGSIIISVIICLSAKTLILLLFGEAYHGAILVLQVYIWSIPATFIGVATGQYLVAENLTRISFFCAFLGVCTNTILNYILIPKYGGVGSAFATVISYTLAGLSIIFFKSSRNQITLLIMSLSPVRFFNALTLRDNTKDKGK
jgi:PST family polysaccharide transporter